MKAFRSGTVLALVTTSILLMSSPAFAWVCTAKNARGAIYTGIGVLKQNAIDRAIAKCKLGSVVNASCYIVSCIP